MNTMDVYGFSDEDLKSARSAIEGALSIRLEEAREEGGSGYYFRGVVPSGTWVQIRSNSGPSLRWQGDPSNPWHPAYRVLVFVHGQAPESIAECLKHSVPGLSFLERKETM
jgi:hypothetical protein